MKEVTLGCPTSKKTEGVNKNITPIIITYSVILSNIMERKSLVHVASVTEGKNKIRKYLCYIKKINKKYKNSAFVYVPMMYRTIQNWLSSRDNIAFKIFGVKVLEEPICIFPMVKAKTSEDVLNYVSILIKNGFVVTKENIMNFFDSFIGIVKKSRSYKILSFAKDFIDRARQNIDDEFVSALNDINFWSDILKETIQTTINNNSDGKSKNGSNIKNPQETYQAMIIVVSLLFSHHNIGDYKPLDMAFE